MLWADWREGCVVGLSGSGSGARLAFHNTRLSARKFNLDTLSDQDVKNLRAGNTLDCHISAHEIRHYALPHPTYTCHDSDTWVVMSRLRSATPRALCQCVLTGFQL